MSSDNEILKGPMIMIKHFRFPREIVEHAVGTFDPSIFRMRMGTVVLRTSGKATGASLDDLMKFGDNKPGDIVLWASMKKSSRTLYISFIENTPLPPDNEAMMNSETCADKIGVILVTYLLHGSLAGFLADKPVVPKFALTATGLKVDDFSKSMITSTDAFCKCKFPKSVQDFQKFAVALPATFLSRIKLSWAGNRVFAILKMVRGKISPLYKDGTAMHFLMSDAVIDASPFFSTHPDHIDNPFHDSVKAIYADIGSKCRQMNIDIELLAKRRPPLFLDAIKNMLHSAPEDVQEKLPTLSKFKTAFTKANSIGDVIKRT